MNKTENGIGGNKDAAHVRGTRLRIAHAAAMTGRTPAAAAGRGAAPWAARGLGGLCVREIGTNPQRPAGRGGTGGGWPARICRGIRLIFLSIALSTATSLLTT
jgi:hypothetical protein